MKTKNNSEIEVMKYRITVLEKKVQELEARLVAQPYPPYRYDLLPWTIPTITSAKEGGQWEI